MQKNANEIKKKKLFKLINKLHICLYYFVSVSKCITYPHIYLNLYNEIMGSTDFNKIIIKKNGGIAFFMHSLY